MVQHQLAHSGIANSRTVSPKTVKRAFYTLGAASLLTFGALALAPRDAHAIDGWILSPSKSATVAKDKPTEHKPNTAVQVAAALFIGLPIIGGLTAGVAAFAITRKI